MSWAEDNLILKTLGGSHAYGLNTPTSDMDFRGVALSPVNWLLGFRPGQESSETAERKHPDTGEDTVIHTLGKFCSLALKGNPNILEVLFCRDEEVLDWTQTGRELRVMRDAFLSRAVFASLSGYAYQQLRNARNHNSYHGAHAEYIEKYGWDTKNGMHLVRLLLMGKEILATGELHVYREKDRDFLLGIRNGSMTYWQVTQMAEEMDAECGRLRERSPLPEKPDRERVEKWLMEVHLRWVNGDSTLLLRS